MAALMNQAAGITTSDVVAVPVGPAIGIIEQRYGLLASQEMVTLDHSICRTGDLAVADRLAFVHASQSAAQVVVVEIEGWFVVGIANRHLAAAQAASVTPVDRGARLMSIVDERGITPIVAPLVMPA